MHQKIIDILPSKIQVAMRALDNDFSQFFDLHDADIEGASSEVENQNYLHDPLVLNMLLICIEYCGGCRLIDDQLTVKARKFACSLGTQPLLIIKIGRHRHNTPSALILRVLLCIFPHFSQDMARYFFRRALFDAFGTWSTAILRFLLKHHLIDWLLVVVCRHGERPNLL